MKWKEILFLKKLIKQNYNNYLNKINLTPEKNIYLQCWANVLRKGEQIKLHFEASSGADKWAIYSYDRTNNHYTYLSLGQNGSI